jgi:hypothetical protein
MVNPPVGADFLVFLDVLDVRTLEIAADVNISAPLQVLIYQGFESVVARQQKRLSANGAFAESRSTFLADVMAISTQTDRWFHIFETYWALQKPG